MRRSGVRISSQAPTWSADDRTCGGRERRSESRPLPPHRAPERVTSGGKRVTRRWPRIPLFPQAPAPPVRYRYRGSLPAHSPPFPGPNQFPGRTNDQRRKLGHLMRRKSSLAGAGIGALIPTLAASIALSLAWSFVASAATAHVSVAPSAAPAFDPPDCGTGTPAYNYEGSGDAADPQVVYSAGTYYAFTTGNGRQQHRGPRVELTQFGLRAVHGQVLRVHGTAEPLVVGAGEHADVAGRLCLRRPLGDVLRRGPVGPRIGLRLRLPGRGHRGAHLPHRCAVQRRVHRSHRMPGNGIHRPPALRRPQHGRGVPNLEAERRRFVGAGLHLVAAV